ncbi:MAG: glycosyltransferase [Rhodocyclaceae bacterium]|jgi:glycosyltransferase involved in cell wall biosynthesis|nr:glycosyltransferase [Rhodocyclaceae bacterium]
MTPRFSIALATCNGARFLHALLDSLAAQSLRPHELVASDDASTDDTLHCLEAFAGHSPFPVRILRNREALGVAGNFGQALSACAGDCIALADQDDVWHPAKLEKLAAALAAPGILAVFSDADVVDADLTPLGYTMWQRVRFTAQEQRRLARGEGFGILLKHRVVTGATLACKVGLRETALPMPPGWPHDAWLALLAAAQDGLAAVPEPLIAYRQHGANLVGGRRRTFLQEARAGLQLDRGDWYREELGLWRALDARLATLSAIAARAALADKIAHLEARARLPASRWRRVPGVLREVLAGRYARHARNWGSIALDLLVP